tara:strand:+ start:818 stop:1057 length:240 start_codon:yes stop_codon:yes gene_type:complete
MMDFDRFKRHVTFTALFGFTIALAVSVIENLDELRYGSLDSFWESFARHGFFALVGVTVGVAIVFWMAYNPRPPRGPRM